MRPSISVLMPVYNCENYITESVQSILNQSFTNFELIINDGGSTDGTLKLIQRYKDKRIRIIEHNERTGIIQSLNEGIHAARGDLIARQDSDDLSDRDRLLKQYSSFCGDGDLAVLGTSYYMIDRHGKIVSKVSPTRNVTYDSFRDGNQLCHGSVMFRKSIIIKEGFYDPLFLTCEDYELWCRLSSKGYKIMNLSEFLYYLRAHSGSVSSKKWQKQIIYSNLIQDIYFGGLKKNMLKNLKRREFKDVYSLLSSKKKRDYHIGLISRYIEAKKYLYVMIEILNLLKVDPSELFKLMNRTLNINNRIFEILRR